MGLNANTIHGFSGSVLARKYDAATPTPRFHLELWELFTSPNKFVAAAAPRGHGKSTAITYAYLLANVLFRERRFVVIVSDTESQSVNFLGDIKTELKENDDLINLFNIKGFIKDTESDIIVEFEDGHSFRIMAKGAEQRLRGTKWNNLRPDLIICHEKGTKVYTPETGWILNQDYPDSRVYKTNSCYKVTFDDGHTEVVSGDHRYLTEEGWKFIWEMKKDDFILENNVGSGTKPTKKNTLKKLKNLILNIGFLKKVKRNVRSGLLKILIRISLANVSTTSKIKRNMTRPLVNMLVSVLNGKLLNVPKDEQESLMLLQVG